MNSECMYTVILGVVEEMEAFCAESSINVRIVEKQSGLFVNIDSSRMQQVIRNLLSNAVRYSPPGADVVFEIVKRGNKCEVRILDSGVGIPQHELESIFDAFTRSSRTDKLAGGTGLGLAISRAIVSNHEGTLTAANRSGGGACFTITLPLPHRSTLAAA